jgi:hypothetical protein
MIILALLLSLPQFDGQAAVADMRQRRDAFKTCIVEQTTRLGAGNTESADTVLRGVSAACKPAEDHLRAFYPLMMLSRRQIDVAIARDRKLAEDQGVAALLTARAAR